MMLESDLLIYFENMKQDIRKQYNSIFNCKQIKPGMSIKMMQISIQNEKKRAELAKQTLMQNYGPWKIVPLNQTKTQQQQNKTQLQTKKTQQQLARNDAIIMQPLSVKKDINIISSKNQNHKVMTIVGRRLDSFKAFKNSYQSQNGSLKKINSQNVNFAIKRLNFLKIMHKEIKNKNPPPKPMILIDIAAGDVKVQNGKMKVRYTVIGNQLDSEIYKNINILNYTDQNWNKIITQPQPQLPEAVINKIEEKQSNNISNQLIKQQQKTLPALITPSNQIVNKLAHPPVLSRDLESKPSQNIKTNIFTQFSHSNITLNQLMQTSNTQRQISSVRPQTNFSFGQTQNQQKNILNYNNPFANKHPTNTTQTLPQNINNQQLNFNYPSSSIPTNLFGGNMNSTPQINPFMPPKRSEPTTGGLFGATAAPQRQAFQNNKKKTQHTRAFS